MHGKKKSTVHGHVFGYMESIASGYIYQRSTLPTGGNHFLNGSFQRVLMSDSLRY